MAGKLSSQFLFIPIILISVVIYVRYIERRALFSPSQIIEVTPIEIGLDFEEIFFKTKDGLRLNGWLIPSGDARFTLLFCHGNAGNISSRIDKIKFFNKLGLNIFIFDYRGYGISQGSPSEAGLYIDAQAAYEYLLSRKISFEKIVGYGESLGGAVVIELAKNNDIKALIVESTFSSAKDMSKQIYPFIPFWLFSSKLNSGDKIKLINAPKLIMHSKDDEIVPFCLADKLYRSASEPKFLLQLHGNHNDCFFESEEIVREEIINFLDKLNLSKSISN